MRSWSIAGALALVLAAAPARAIEHVSDVLDGQFNAFGHSFPVEVAPGEDRYLLAGIALQGPVPVRGVTLGGQALGLIGVATSPSSSCRVEWWGLVAPPTGVHTMMVDLMARTFHVGVSAILYRGVAGLGSVGVFVPASGPGGPSLVTIASAPGEVVLDAVCGWAPDSQLDLAGPDQVARWHWSTGSLSSAASQKAGAAQVTLSWTASGPGPMEWGAAALTLRPSGSPIRADFDVRTAGCGVGAPGRVEVFPSSLLVLIALGTLVARSRATITRMRPSTSRSAPAGNVVPLSRYQASHQVSHQPDLDQATLARAKAGDPAAQAAIVHRYERPVFSLLWRIVGPQRALVEDLTQETFLRVLRALNRFEHDGRARMITWVLSIATRLALDHLRACKPRQDAAIAPGAVPVTLPGPDQEVGRRALAVALVEAVDGLRPAFRAAFILREVHGLSYEEIGAALSIDVGTVKSRLARARAVLQAALAEMHDE